MSEIKHDANLDISANQLEAIVSNKEAISKVLLYQLISILRSNGKEVGVLKLFVYEGEKKSK